MFMMMLAMLVAALPAAAQPQDTAALWRSFAERVEVGTSLRVRLYDGRAFTATLVRADPDALMLQPKTRVPVPVQPVPYEAIASLDRTRGGIGAGKAAAIGIATGVGAFFATLLIFLAAVAD
jgi:S1-C subfamily serine protease